MGAALKRERRLVRRRSVLVGKNSKVLVLDLPIEPDTNLARC